MCSLFWELERLVANTILLYQNKSSSIVGLQEFIQRIALVTFYCNIIREDKVSSYSSALAYNLPHFTSEPGPVRQRAADLSQGGEGGVSRAVGTSTVGARLGHPALPAVVAATGPESSEQVRTKI